MRSSYASNGPGAHHIGFQVDDLDAAHAIGEAGECRELMSGDFGNLRFCYLDTWDALGLYLEVVEDPDGMLMSVMPWR